MDFGGEGESPLQYAAKQNISFPNRNYHSRTENIIPEQKQMDSEQKHIIPKQKQQKRIWSHICIYDRNRYLAGGRYDVVSMVLFFILQHDLTLAPCK